MRLFLSCFYRRGSVVLSIMQMSEVMQRYLETVSPNKKGYAQEIFRVRHLMKSFLGSMLIGDIKTSEIARYRDERLAEKSRITKTTIAPATVRLEINLLSAIFNEARREWQLCETNPVEHVRKPKVPRGRTRRLSRGEEIKIRNYCDTYSNKELRLIVNLALESCMRQGELLGLTWQNINLQSGVAHLADTKNGSSRDVPLSIKAREVLRSFKNLRLSDRSGKALKKDRIFNFTSSGVKTAWRIMTQKLEIANLHFHDLRHEAISRLFELGTLNVVEISSISGHRSLNILSRYTHLRAKNLVPKLDSKQKKIKDIIAQHLMPFPATISKIDEDWVVKVPDFDNLTVRSKDRDECLHLAKLTLCQKLVSAIQLSQTLPEPHSEDLDENGDRFLLDPLG